MRGVLNINSPLSEIIYRIMKYILIIPFIVIGNLLLSENDLEIIKQLPVSDEVFLQHPESFVIDNEGQVHVLDHRRSMIYTFDSEGQLKDTKGRSGSGPQEFDLPTNIVFDDAENKLIVSDSGNRRLHFIELESGNWRTQVIDEHFPRSFAADSGLLIAFQANSFRPAQEQPLVTVNDYHGAKQKTFGEMLSYYEDMPAVLSRPLIEVYEDKIYVLFRRFPILRIYNLEGDLEEEIYLEHELYKDIHATNRDPEIYEEGRAVHGKSLFEGFGVTSEGIYVILSANEHLGDGNLIIDHFNLEGIHKNRLQKNMNIRFIYHSSVFKNADEDELLFYISKNEEDNTISILKPN